MNVWVTPVSLPIQRFSVLEIICTLKAYFILKNELVELSHEGISEQFGYDGAAPRKLAGDLLALEALEEDNEVVSEKVKNALSMERSR